MGVLLSSQFKTSGYLACRSQLEISLSLHIVAVSIAWRNTHSNTQTSSYTRTFFENRSYQTQVNVALSSSNYSSS
jgi:hypothetical protein